MSDLQKKDSYSQIRKSLGFFYGVNGKIFLISFLSLYLELALIRWIGSEIRIFAYLSNLVLIACFLGLGIGCFQARLPFNPFHVLVVLTIIIFSVTEPFGIRTIPLRRITEMVSVLSDSLIWSAWTLKDDSGMYKVLVPVAGVLLTVLAFFMTALVFIPLGRYLGSLLDACPNIISAYSVNVLGGLAGMWMFVFLSFMGTSPALWFALFLSIMIMYVPKRQRLVWVLISACIVIMLLPPRGKQMQVKWSPYQKLILSPLFTSDHKLKRGYLLEVNHTFYQDILDLSEDFLAAHPEYFSPDNAKLSHYELPYHFAKKRDRMLIVGAGTGNDAAAALRNEVKKIDAVEIDPVIAEMGRRYHPENPYKNERVRIIIEDARAFLHQASEKYDIIWFGLLDSHSLGSSYNNLRLDHYVYTMESFKRVRELLSEDGIVVVIFLPQREWIAKRLYALLSEVFGEHVLAFKAYPQVGYYSWENTVIIASREDVALRFNNIDERARDYIRKNLMKFSGNVRLTTDDWPYLYIDKARVPSMHLLVSLALIICFVFLRKGILKVPAEGLKINWAFFFLGSGFLLFEVQSVSKAALLLGSTWIVNSVIISEILVWILFSNYVYAKFRIKRMDIVLVILILYFLALYIVPVSYFHKFGSVIRFTLGSSFLTLPAFFAGLIFIDLFQRAPSKNRALGSNLIGALFGGSLESLSFLVGIKALLIPTALFYVVAFAFREREQMTISV